MRIIRDAGNEIEKKVICGNCGVEVGYVPIDTREEKHYDYTGDFDFYKFISCPNCNEKIEVR